MAPSPTDPRRVLIVGMRERAVSRLVGAGGGGFRGWEEIASWAGGIADGLRVGAAR
jgi:hypothetical protein